MNDYKADDFGGGRRYRWDAVKVRGSYLVEGYAFWLVSTLV